MSAKRLYDDAPISLVPLDDPRLIQCIGEVRAQLEKEFSNENNRYWSIDIEKLKTCDFEIRRYLFQANLDVNLAVQMIKERLLWRIEMDLPNAKSTRFPLEFYQAGGIFEFKTDLQGDPVLYVRSKFNVRLEVLARPFRQFLVYHMDRMDQRFSRERSWGLVFDAQGFTWNNIDFDFLHFIIQVLKYYMPWSVKYVIIYEIPWFLEPIWNTAKHFIPEDGKRLLRVYNKKTIKEAIDPVNMPKIIGGLSPENHIVIPEDVQPATVIGKLELDLSDEDIKQIKKHLAKMDKEIAKTLIAN